MPESSIPSSIRSSRMALRHLWAASPRLTIAILVTLSEIPIGFGRIPSGRCRERKATALGFTPWAPECHANRMRYGSWPPGQSSRCSALGGGRGGASGGTLGGPSAVAYFSHDPEQLLHFERLLDDRSRALRRDERAIPGQQHDPHSWALSQH